MHWKWKWSIQSIFHNRVIFTPLLKDLPRPHHALKSVLSADSCHLLNFMALLFTSSPERSEALLNIVACVSNNLHILKKSTWELHTATDLVNLVYFIPNL